jgi:hypothetical protein
MFNFIVGSSHRKYTNDNNDILRNYIEYIFICFSYDYIGSTSKEIYKFLIIFNIITFKFSLMIHTSPIEFGYSENVST